MEMDGNTRMIRSSILSLTPEQRELLFAWLEDHDFAPQDRLRAHFEKMGQVQRLLRQLIAEGKEMRECDLLALFPAQPQDLNPRERESPGG